MDEQQRKAEIRELNVRTSISLLEAYTQLGMDETAADCFKRQFLKLLEDVNTVVID